MLDRAVNDYDGFQTILQTLFWLKTKEQKAEGFLGWRMAFNSIMFSAAQQRLFLFHSTLPRTEKSEPITCDHFTQQISETPGEIVTMQFYSRSTIVNWTPVALINLELSRLWSIPLSIFTFRPNIRRPNQFRTKVFQTEKYPNTHLAGKQHSIALGSL